MGLEPSDREVDYTFPDSILFRGYRPDCFQLIRPYHRYLQIRSRRHDSSGYRYYPGCRQQNTLLHLSGFCHYILAYKFLWDFLVFPSLPWEQKVSPWGEINSSSRSCLNFVGCTVVDEATASCISSLKADFLSFIERLPAWFVRACPLAHSSDEERFFVSSEK